MLFTVQFPLADSRGFLERETYTVEAPSWLTPLPGVDFVRSFGMVRRRPRGGLSGWLGEGVVCEADRALRFRLLQPYVITDERKVLFKVVYRRFYFDGMAVGKFEVGIAGWDRSGRPLTEEESEGLLYHLLRRPVAVPDPTGEEQRCELWQAGQALADLYRVSTTQTAVLGDGGVPQRWWVAAGEPVALLTHDVEEEAVAVPFWGRSVPLPDFQAGHLAYHRVPLDGRQIGLWVIGEEWTSNWLRELRIFLLRLHAEREVLRLVLRHLAAGRIEVTPRSGASNFLQYYLNEATRHIGRLREHSDERAAVDTAELARSAGEFVHPGERDALFQALRAIDVRKNIMRKVADFVGEEVGV